MGKFIVKSPISHNKTLYKAGSEIEMEDAIAKPLIEDGILLLASEAETKIFLAQATAEAKKKAQAEAEKAAVEAEKAEKAAQSAMEPEADSSSKKGKHK